MDNITVNFTNFKKNINDFIDVVTSKDENFVTCFYPKEFFSGRAVEYKKFDTPDLAKEEYHKMDCTHKLVVTKKTE